MKALLPILPILLAACSSPDPEISAAPREAARDPSAFDPVTIEPIERARGVQDTIFEADAERRRQLDAQELGN